VPARKITVTTFFAPFNLGTASIFVIIVTKRAPFGDGSRLTAGGCGGECGGETERERERGNTRKRAALKANGVFRLGECHVIYVNSQGARERDERFPLFSPRRVTLARRMRYGINPTGPGKPVTFLRPAPLRLVFHYATFLSGLFSYINT